MAIKRAYKSLPFVWNPKTCQNDCLWLESMIRNTAPFSDGWTKARIVQLAYPHPAKKAPAPVNQLPIYAGLASEQAIVEAVRSLCDLSQYPDFAREVDEKFVVRTLNQWHTRQFNQAISRNFEVYVDRNHSNIFLVTSTATISLNVDRELPPLERFRPLFNIDEMARLVIAAGCQRLTLRIHGYATPDPVFYQSVIEEAETLTLKGPINNFGTLEEGHFYIGYHWPSEQPLLSAGLWADYRHYWGIVLKFLLVMSGLSLIFGTLIYLFLELIGVPLLTALGSVPALDQVWQFLKVKDTTAIAIQWHWIVLTVFTLWLLVIQIMRVVVYQRDRYRAIHYGAPDLAEFFWRLDKAIDLQQCSSKTKKKDEQKTTKKSQITLPNIQTKLDSKIPQIAVNLIGHSMGALVVVNVLRILSDRFGKDDRLEQEKKEMGDYLRLDKLILTSPDIPLEFMREGRNNYIRSAILRCREIYLFSSDRDVVLRYLSTLANWFTEPSLEMSGLRLGNVYLRPVNRPQDPVEYRPYIRIMIQSQPAAKPTSAYELFEKFNYLDCSEIAGVNCTSLALNPFTGLIIDLINVIAYLFGRIDSHGGYFWTETPSFAVLQFILANNNVTETTMQAGIKRIIADSPIRYLPSQPFLIEDFMSDEE